MKYLAKTDTETIEAFLSAASGAINTEQVARILGMKESALLDFFAEKSFAAEFEKKVISLESALISLGVCGKSPVDWLLEYRPAMRARPLDFNAFQIRALATFEEDIQLSQGGRLLAVDKSASFTRNALKAAFETGRKAGVTCLKLCLRNSGLADQLNEQLKAQGIRLPARGGSGFDSLNAWAEKNPTCVVMDQVERLPGRMKSFAEIRSFSQFHRFVQYIFITRSKGFAFDAISYDGPFYRQVRLLMINS